MGPRQQLGEVLLAAGLITPEQLRSALDNQRSSRLRLGEVLVGLGYVTEADVARAVAGQLGIPFIPDHELQVDFHVARLLPPHVARRKLVLPVAEQLGKLVLAMSDPLDVVTIDEVRFLTGRPIESVSVTRSAVERAVAQYERIAAMGSRDRSADGGPVVTLPPEMDQAPVIRLVNEQIDRAIEEAASDIHIEPGEEIFRIRFRVDGFLREVLAPAINLHPAVVARIKVMAGLDISERRLPQDGRIVLRDEHRSVDIRVNTLPTIHGEKVVLRIFDKNRRIPDLAHLGFNPADGERYRAVIGRPHGMLLVTGPTGSGKTTTLMSTLAHLVSPDKNIVTIEDPVEYQLSGVNHVQVNSRSGLTFAQGLRAILRQDPNIIMIGEIRDAETANVAVRAALTGHLVVSTLHTNDAPSAVARLTDMGVEAYLVASSVRGVLAQRLVRSLCQRCRTLTWLEPEVLAPYTTVGSTPTRAFRAKGCHDCRGTGYTGRFPIFEFMSISPPMRRLVARGADTATLREQAIKEGMSSLLSNGVERVLAGDTTLEEVLRVAEYDD